MKKSYLFKFFVAITFGLIVVGCSDDDESEVPEIPTTLTKVDLNLPSGTEWLSCNLGATAPEDFGGYYVFDNSKDIVSSTLGDSYTTPTKEQFEELMTHTTPSWAEINGVKGMTFTGTNGNSIFLPAAAQLWYDDEDKEWGINNEGSGAYWTSSARNSNYNWFVEFNDGKDKDESPFFGDRHREDNKLTIRPVYNGK